MSGLLLGVHVGFLFISDVGCGDEVARCWLVAHLARTFAFAFRAFAFRDELKVNDITLLFSIRLVWFPVDRAQSE